jgi:hypothetical protein
LAKEQFNKDLAERRAKAGVTAVADRAQTASADRTQTKSEDELAAVAYALYLAGKKPKEGIITLPRIKSTAWNHKHYTLK